MEHYIKPIPGFEGYYCNKYGDVFTAWVTGKKPYINTDKMKRKSVHVMRNGYTMCSLRIKNSTYYVTGVHRLVLLAFKGIPKEGYTASHINGDRKDNRLENLKWESQNDNLKRKIQHGTHDRGSNNSRALLSRKQIEKIRLLLSEGKHTHDKIGKMFGVSRAFISKVKGGYRYKYD